jgi:ABC-type bacteriocin/lantibiotic exporter with double-glycine peptidase domain
MGMLKVLDLPMREQKYDFDCSVAAGWSLLKYNKIKVEYNTLLKASKVCPVDGLSPIKLVNLLKKFGLNVELQEHKNIRFLKGQINKGNPTIILLQHRKEYNKSWEDTWIYGHYGVMFGFDNDNDKVFIYNPSMGGTKILTYEQLNSRWHDEWNGGTFIKTVIIIN